MQLTTLVFKHENGGWAYEISSSDGSVAELQTILPGAPGVELMTKQVATDLLAQRVAALTTVQQAWPSQEDWS